MVKIKNKNRLYLAVTGSRLTDRTPRLNWGFLIGPKIEDKYINEGIHFVIVKDQAGQWRSQSTNTQNVQSVRGVLARVLFAKIEDDQRLVEILHATIASTAADDNGDADADAAAASCKWAEAVLARLASDGKIVGTAQLDWEKLHLVARAYVGQKIAEERYREEERMVLPTPTWDMLTWKELAP